MGIFDQEEQATATIAELESQVTRLRELCGEAGRIIARYHDETPTGHQPHMIVAEAEEFLQRLKNEGVK